MDKLGQRDISQTEMRYLPGSRYLSMSMESRQRECKSFLAHFHLMWIKPLIYIIIDPHGSGLDPCLSNALHGAWNFLERAIARAKKSTSLSLGQASGTGFGRGHTGCFRHDS